jgi:hypothetical protein
MQGAGWGIGKKEQVTGNKGGKVGFFQVFNVYIDTEVPIIFSFLPGSAQVRVALCGGGGDSAARAAEDPWHTDDASGTGYHRADRTGGGGSRHHGSRAGVHLGLAPFFSAHRSGDPALLVYDY